MRGHRRAAQAAPTANQPGPSTRPPPAAGARNLVLVVLDSLRYDTCVAAKPRTMMSLGEIEPRYSYATWTAPSHYNLLTGLLPHTSPRGVVAAAYYREEYAALGRRLGVEDLGFQNLLPHLFLPTLLREHLGYVTNAYVSMPVLNPHTLLNHDFDRYELMENHHDLPGIISRLRFSDERPSFHLLNVGETHYPYSFEGDDGSHLPHLSGLHGAVKSMSSGRDSGAEVPFSGAELDELKDRQVRAAGYVDGLLDDLLGVVPANTWVIVTADHGELFGEDGYFGHGPIQHEKVMQVPFLEGLRS